MRDTLRAARFLGIVFPADFMILLSALRTASAAAALSPPDIAFNAFFTKVLTADLRAVLTVFFFFVTKMRFFADL